MATIMPKKENNGGTTSLPLLILYALSKFWTAVSKFWTTTHRSQIIAI